jgi:hypothetical protein
MSKRNENIFLFIIEEEYARKKAKQPTVKNIFK